MLAPRSALELCVAPCSQRFAVTELQPRRVAAGGPAAAGQDAWASLWAQWKAHYGKTYPDAHGLTEAQAFATFAANMQKVVEHNLAAQATYWLSGNE